MKKIKIAIYAGFVSMLLVGCSNSKNVETKTETVKETSIESSVETSKDTVSESTSEITDNSFDEYVQDGGFYFNNKGKLVAVKDVKNQKVLEWYSEPLCPDCHNLEEETGSYLLEIMGDNTLIKYYPITFIGRPKDNPSFVTYSDKLSGTILAIAKNDPDLAYTFVKKVINKLYATLNYESNDHLGAFKKTYEEIGGKNWDKISADIDNGIKLALAKINSLKTDQDVISVSPNNRIETPMLYLVGEEKAFNYIGASSEQIRKELESRLK